MTFILKCLCACFKKCGEEQEPTHNSVFHNPHAQWRAQARTIHRRVRSASQAIAETEMSNPILPNLRKPLHLTYYRSPLLWRVLVVFSQVLALLLIANKYHEFYLSHEYLKNYIDSPLYQDPPDGYFRCIPSDLSTPRLKCNDVLEHCQHICDEVHDYNYLFRFAIGLALPALVLVINLLLGIIEYVRSKRLTKFGMYYKRQLFTQENVPENYRLINDTPNLNTRLKTNRRLEAVAKNASVTVFEMFLRQLIYGPAILTKGHPRGWVKDRELGRQIKVDVEVDFDTGEDKDETLAAILGPYLREKSDSLLCEDGRMNVVKIIRDILSWENVLRIERVFYDFTRRAFDELNILLTQFQQHAAACGGNGAADSTDDATGSTGSTGGASNLAEHSVFSIATNNSEDDDEDEKWHIEAMDPAAQPSGRENISRLSNAAPPSSATFYAGNASTADFSVDATNGPEHLPPPDDGIGVVRRW